jgi:cytochrome c2
MRVLSCCAILLLAMWTGTQPASAQADAENGKDLYKACRTCHQLGDGAKSTPQGPSLNGIVGRKAGTIEGYGYSEANKQAGEKGLVWTEE